MIERAQWLRVWASAIWVQSVESSRMVGRAVQRCDPLVSQSLNPKP